MKNLLAVIAFLFVFIEVQAQSPKLMSYQGVARDAQGQTLVNKQINLRLAIISADDVNEAAYKEEQLVTTNEFGLFAIKIGEGSVLTGSMNDIDWGSADHFISVEMDAHNNGHYAFMGTSQLLSVPYAFYAETAGKASNLENVDQMRAIDFDGEFGQTIRHNGSEWEASSIIYVDVENVGFGTTAPIAKLDINGSLNLSQGNEITFGGDRALAMDANRNLMQGRQTGASLTTGVNNNMIGYRAGWKTTSGDNNSIIGYNAGYSNTTGSSNMFLGYKAGYSNTVGSNNFFGGLNAGYGTTSGINNIALGTTSGFNLGAANNNTFVGRNSGYNTMANENVFIGYEAGYDNTTGTQNTYIGTGADGSAGLTNATAIGANALVAANNSVVLGNLANVGIGTSVPQSKLHVQGGVRIVDGTEANGLVLTSDANGNASWAPVSSLAVASAFDTLGGVVLPGSAVNMAEDDFVFGSSQLDNDGDLNHRSRFFFDKSKGAFRAGYTTSVNWDADSIGDYSFAVGHSTKASGNNSVATGLITKATGDMSTAMGLNSTASGSTSRAMGSNVTSSGDMSTAMGFASTASGYTAVALGNTLTSSGDFSITTGFNATASGNSSIAMGSSVTSSGNFSATMGSYSTASGNSSTAFGTNLTSSGDFSATIGHNSTASGYTSRALGSGVTSSGDFSTAIGYGSTASGYISTAIGNAIEASAPFSAVIGSNSTANGSNSMVLGHYLTALSGFETVIGRYNTNYTPADTTGWNSSDRLFSIGNGLNPGSLSDAMVVLKSGEIGIGTSTPDTTLHLVGKMKYQDGTQADGRVLTSDANGNATWEALPAYDVIVDGDGDTKIQVEESSDDDIIRFTLAGTERFVMQGGRLEVVNSSRNTLIGDNAGLNLSTGNVNTFIGFEAGKSASTAEVSVAIGAYALDANTEGASNVAVGNGTLTENTNGSLNTALGYVAGRNNLGSGNVFIGFSAGYNETGSDKLYIENSNANSSNALIYGEFDNDMVRINGSLGVGTTPVNGKLEVSGSKSAFFSEYGFLAYTGVTGNITNQTNNYSIYTDDRIAATEFNAFSDRRIKNIKGVSNSTDDLSTLMDIEVTDYTMIDTVGESKKQFKKVIAQQVKDVYPQAIASTQIVRAIPDIYQISTIEDGWINLSTTLTVGDRVKLILANKEETVEVLETSEEGFKVNLQETGDVFVYGREVNDFHTVDYEAISMLNVSATQELAKRLGTLEKENEELKAQLQEEKVSNQARLERLEAELGIGLSAEKK